MERYSRQTVLAEVGESGQAALRRARLLIIGAGGLGCPCAQYLVAAGVGELGLVDSDCVELSNLQRQILYTTADIGRKKAEAARERLLALNPEVTIKAYTERFRLPAAAQLVQDYDLIIDGSDNFATRYLINDLCVTFEKPFITAAILRFEGQLMLCNATINGSERGPTYRCLYPESPNPLEQPDCQTAGVLGSVAGVLGVLQAQEALKYLLNCGQFAQGQLFRFDFISNKFDTFQVRRNSAACELSQLKSPEYYQQLEGCRMDSAIKEINAIEALELLQHSTVFLDVRETGERQQRSLGGLHIPLGQLPQRLQELPPSASIVCYCASGIRSLTALEFLKQRSQAKNYYNLAGGIKAVSTELEQKFLQLG